MIGKSKAVFDVTDTDTRAASDNIGAWMRAGTDGELIDSTSNALWVHLKASDVALNVELDHTDGDSVQIGDGTEIMLVNADGSINATVTATNLDIRDLTHATDSIKIGDGTDFLAIDGSGNIGVTDAGGSLTVDAVNLDIRDLAAATDTVSAWTKDGSGNAISSVGGALQVTDLANTAVAATAVAVNDSADALPTSALASRKFLYVQNNGNKDMYLGPAGVSTTSGLRLPPSAVAEFKLGPAVSLYGITATGFSVDARVMELS